TGADSREVEALRTLHVYDPPSRQVTLEGARGLLFDLSPSFIGDRGEFPMEIIHILPLFSANQCRVNRRAETIAMWTGPQRHALSRSGRPSMGPLPLSQHSPGTSPTAQKTACRSRRD